MALFNRAKQKLIQPDFGFYIQELVRAGYTYAEISSLTGIGIEMLRVVAGDLQSPPKAWHSAVKLLDLYMMACKRL